MKKSNNKMVTVFIIGVLCGLLAWGVEHVYVNHMQDLEAQAAELEVTGMKLTYDRIAREYYEELAEDVADDYSYLDDEEQEKVIYAVTYGDTEVEGIYEYVISIIYDNSEVIEYHYYYDVIDDDEISWIVANDQRISWNSADDLYYDIF